MLAEWAEPSGQDRVVGDWRPLPQRDAAIARNAAQPVLEPIIMSAPDTVRIAAIELIEKIGAPDAGPAVQRRQEPGHAARRRRRGAGGDGSSTKDPQLEEAVEAALKTGKGALRSAAIKQLVAPRDAGARLNAILAAGAIADQQAVLSTLGHDRGQRRRRADPADVDGQAARRHGRAGGAARPARIGRQLEEPTRSSRSSRSSRRSARGEGRPAGGIPRGAGRRRRGAGDARSSSSAPTSRACAATSSTAKAASPGRT